jgi:dienelactone hydrolase
LASLKALSVTSVSAALIVWGIGKTATAATFKSASLFNNVANYTTIISGNNELADIYFPNPSNLKTGNYSFPVALLLQGANVDKSNYSNYARTVASYGFVVVVPNRLRTIPQFNLTGLFAETSQIDETLAQIKTENLNQDSPIAGVVNTTKIGLLGHSQGGAVGLSAIANLCIPILCEGSFNRPNELVAGAFFGANLRNQATNEFIPINNSGIPIALLQGTADGIALPFRAQATYDQIQNPPKALINILGANHYGITNINNPTGSIPDRNAPTIAQNMAVEAIARWSGLFLRASIIGDQDAFNYVYSTGDALDSNVTVISQGKPIPEESSTLLGLVLVSASGTAFRLKKGKQKIQQRRNKSIV